MFILGIQRGPQKFALQCELISINVSTTAISISFVDSITIKYGEISLPFFAISASSKCPIRSKNAIFVINLISGQ